MNIWSSFQQKRGKQRTSDVELKIALLAGVLMSESDKKQHRHTPSLAQEPSDLRRALYGEDRSAGQ